MLNSNFIFIYLIINTKTMKAIFFILAAAFSFAFSAPEKSFSGSFTIQTESTKNKQQTTLCECYAKDAKLLAIISMGDKKKKTLVNGDEKNIYYLDDEKKTAVKISVKDMEGQANTEPPQITETNEYKTIDGYKCRKTNEVNKKSTSEIWTTEDLDADFSKVAGAFACLARKKGGLMGPNYGLKGFPIEIITTENGDGFITTIHYKNIKAGGVDDSKFDLIGYKITDVMGAEVK